MSFVSRKCYNWEPENSFSRKTIRPGACDRMLCLLSLSPLLNQRLPSLNSVILYFRWTADFDVSDSQLLHSSSSTEICPIKLELIRMSAFIFKLVWV